MPTLRVRLDLSHCRFPPAFSALSEGIAGKRSRFAINGRQERTRNFRPSIRAPECCGKALLSAHLRHTISAGTQVLVIREQMAGTWAEGVRVRQGSPAEAFDQQLWLSKKES